MVAANPSTDMTQHPLQAEMATYNSRLIELIGSVGKFVLIHGTSIEGIYDTYADALRIGYDRFKLEPFLVKQIAPSEQVQFFSRELAFECQV